VSDAEAPPPKKKKPLLLIIIAVNVLLGGGAAAFLMLRGGHEAPPAEGDEHGEKGGDAHGDGHGDGEEPARAPKNGRQQGPLVEFSPIIVNLNEPEGARFLKIQVVVQLANDSFSDIVENAKPIVRDHFIRELSDLNFRQTMGNKAKLAIKRRLIKRFNESVGADAAVDIHITQFVVQ
jgi:flagellar FliL protein